LGEEKFRKTAEEMACNHNKPHGLIPGMIMVMVVMIFADNVMATDSSQNYMQVLPVMVEMICEYSFIRNGTYKSNSCHHFI
jgi:hypothetical protein